MLSHSQKNFRGVRKFKRMNKRVEEIGAMGK